MSPVPVVLVDVDVGLTPDRLADVAEMLTVVSQRDFARPEPFGYGVGASVRVATNPHDIAPGEWVLGYFSHPDVAGALGYHDLAPNGMPVAKVFPTLDDPAKAGVTESHELFEMLADALCTTCVVGPDDRVRAREPGDPVEATDFEYVCTSGRAIRCSNWVTPQYFQPVAQNVAFDHMGLVRFPGEILAGGYQIFWDAAAKQWTQVTAGFRRPYRAALADAGRFARRLRRHAAPSAPSAR